MVRRKTLSPRGASEDVGSTRNAHLTINRDELSVAGLEVGEQVLVHVRDEQIIVERSDI